MKPFLLSTKLRIPSLSPHVLHRTHLSDVIEREIPWHKLILISAAAGYGKTTLLTQWANTSQFPIIWLSVSEEDDDVARFLRYLLAGWENVQPDVIESQLGLLLNAMMPDTEAVLSAFINIANDVTEHMIFVLDDYHLINEPPIHEALTYLLEHLPPTLHFVLACRAEPPLPLARYRAHGEMLEFRAGDLQFSPEETADFVNRPMGLDLSSATLATLQKQLEGWAAGLQLVALSLRHHPQAADKLVISGKHRFIADYLSEDVLNHLSVEVKRFLLYTSILKRLCAALCDAVTGRTDGQDMLETLEREQMFLVPLDDRREWYRYHRLFADFLNGRLQRDYPDVVSDLHHRAARWFLDHDQPELAFQHAVAGNNIELVTTISERYVPAKLLGGEIRVVQRWVDSLPEVWQSTYPALGLLRAGILLATGQFDACARCLDEIERKTLAKGETKGQPLARVTALRCYIACYHNDLVQAERLADQALASLPEDDVGERPGIHIALGDTYRRNGLWQRAQESYLHALDFTHAPSFRVQSAHVYGALADLELRQGHLRTAAGYWRKALSALQERENQGRQLSLPVIGWVHIRMGELLYEWNELVEASEHVLRGLEHAELGGDVRAMIAGYLIAGRLELTKGDIEAAVQYLEQARPHVESAQFAHWISRFERFQLEVWLAQDRLRTAVNWSDEMLSDVAIEERPGSEVAELAIARVLIVKGDALAVERALALLKPLLQMEEEGRTGLMIEALALQAIAHWRRGERVSAMTSLERALRLAEPEGYVRRFADLGLPMARLLQEAHARAVMPDYVETLLASFGTDFTLPASIESALPEPPTPREKEILELVAAGLTNVEIADELVIALTTVKKHVSNILGKLGVSNRTEAAARARELDMLD